MTPTNLDSQAFELIQQFASGASQVRSAVAGMTDAQLHARPIAGKWSTHDVVCHLVDADILYAARLQRILSEDNPALQAADPDRLTAALAYSSRRLHEELALMDSLRKQMTRLFQSVSGEGWNRPWVHSTDGPLTLLELLRRISGHVPHHVSFIVEKRRALGLDDVLQSRSPSEYSATIRWSLSGSGFLKGQYSREHTWTFDGGLTVPASPSPHVVPAPWSNTTCVDPEEAFVAAIASCHMLTFLWLASKSGFVVSEYVDTASGQMTKNEQRIPWVSAVTLRPQITWSGERVPTAPELEALHAKAHEQCFIANSVRSHVQVDVP